MLKVRRIALIGGGNMAESLLTGLLRNGLTSSERVIVSDPQRARRDLLARRFGVTVCADNDQAATRADLLLLCVEPQILDEVLAGLKSTVVGGTAGDFPRCRLSNLPHTAAPELSDQSGTRDA